METSTKIIFAFIFSMTIIAIIILLWLRFDPILRDLVFDALKIVFAKSS